MKYDPQKFLKGTLRMHRDGYGFVAPLEPNRFLEGDVFIPPEQAKNAMHGDKVVVRYRRHGPKTEGEVVKVLERHHRTVVGEFQMKRRNFVKPHDDRIQHWIEIPEGMERPPASSPHRVGVAAREIRSAEDLHGLIVNVELLDYPDDDGPAIGRVIEVLGHPDDFGVDVEVMIRKHQLPHQFPQPVLDQARQAAQPAEADLKDREDFRSYDIVTIDGETARDFDDAVWVGRTESGNWALHVHIADVSHYVRPGTPIDFEAQNRGTSVYFPDRAVPMLPVELSTDICSLRPGVDRLVVSALIEIDHRGETVAARFTPGVIRSAARMTYTEVHRILEEDAPGDKEKYARMRDLALILNKRRVQRGSIDFDLPEPLIEFDEFGEMVGVKRAPRNIAHRIIEEFMLCANEAVATHLEERGIPSLFRIHEIPDSKRVLEFEEVASRFGVSLGVGHIPARKHSMVQRTRDGRKIRKDVVLTEDSKTLVTSRHYQKLIAKIEGRAEERVLSYLMLRSLKQARYSAKNEGHFALASESYTHFTSPIRRYPDLIVHRILTGRDRPVPEELFKIGDDCSFTERRAAEAERELVEWKKAKFMLDRVGEEYSGIIVSTAKFGFFVELTELFVEGLVPIDTLSAPGKRRERFNYNESTRQIIGERSRRAFSIGDKLRVLLVRVDAVERRIYFSVL